MRRRRRRRMKRMIFKKTGTIMMTTLRHHDLCRTPPLARSWNVVFAQVSKPPPPLPLHVVLLIVATQ
jgi:hypothetical protein